MRLLLHIVLPLIIPIIIYIIWVYVDSKRKGQNKPEWKTKSWFWSIFIGLMLVAASLIYLSTLGNELGKKYQSPILKDGKIVPGHFK
ncbi:MAG: hypothetical protein CMM67_07495 [Rhodospirillaceae bacterium]|nr:hypothetical protein [Rhodospirillaceae bacterium]OUT77944.1 MAG: hypothetical protein CBB83_07680 [Rhodospirillaceae bacterium TMED23]|tara:strand:- start:3015 stop:3275 length:261 start_codon:yes stop_codon:yes gene_type:complete